MAKFESGETVFIYVRVRKDIVKRRAQVIGSNDTIVVVRDLEDGKIRRFCNEGKIEKVPTEGDVKT